MRRVGYKHPHCRYADWDSDAHPLDRQSLLWAARQPPSASRLLAIQSPLLPLPLPIRRRYTASTLSLGDGWF